MPYASVETVLLGAMTAPWSDGPMVACWTSVRLRMTTAPVRSGSWILLQSDGSA